MPRRTTRTMQACEVFCATPTTGAVERIFSIAGFVTSSRRTSLSDEMFEFLLFNHLNSDLRTFCAIVDEQGWASISNTGPIPSIGFDTFSLLQ